MKICAHVICPPQASRGSGVRCLFQGAQRAKGFSLVEVVMALGLFAFAIVPTIGLLATGLTTLRDAMNDTVRVGILREVEGEAQRTAWDQVQKVFGAGEFFYTEEGMRLPSETDAVFVAESRLGSSPGLLGGNGDRSKLLRVTVRHVLDSSNQLEHSQLLVRSDSKNSKQ